MSGFIDGAFPFRPRPCRSTHGKRTGARTSAPPQPSMPVEECAAPTGFDSGEPRWRR
ncbi:phage DNA packaging protein J [Streptomyces polychromogenes]|nr:phage DNA packaging protein J [Streptomyces polychromogenes]